MKSSAFCTHGKRGPRKGHVGPNGMTHCAIFTQSDSGPQGLAFGDSLEAARSGRLVGASAGRGRRETESLVSVSQNTRHRAHRSRAARDWCLAFTTGRGTETIRFWSGRCGRRGWSSLAESAHMAAADMASFRQEQSGQRALSFEAPRAK